MDKRRLDLQSPLRSVEFHILLSLAGGERHGYGIIQDIQERGEATVPDVKAGMSFIDVVAGGGNARSKGFLVQAK